jgi:hypothetical protein
MALIAAAIFATMLCAQTSTSAPNDPSFPGTEELLAQVAQDQKRIESLLGQYTFTDSGRTVFATGLECPTNSVRGAKNSMNRGVSTTIITGFGNHVEWARIRIVLKRDEVGFPSFWLLQSLGWLGFSRRHGVGHRLANLKD